MCATNWRYNTTCQTFFGTYTASWTTSSHSETCIISWVTNTLLQGTTLPAKLPPSLWDQLCLLARLHQHRACVLLASLPRRNRQGGSLDLFLSLQILLPAICMQFCRLGEGRSIYKDVGKPSSTLSEDFPVWLLWGHPHFTLALWISPINPFVPQGQLWWNYTLVCPWNFRNYNACLVDIPLWAVYCNCFIMLPSTPHNFCLYRNTKYPVNIALATSHDVSLHRKLSYNIAWGYRARVRICAWKCPLLG